MCVGYLKNRRGVDGSARVSASHAFPVACSDWLNLLAGKLRSSGAGRPCQNRSRWIHPVLTVGLGALMNDLPMTGEMTELRGRAESRIDLIRTLWEGGKSYHGRHLRL